MDDMATGGYGPVVAHSIHPTEVPDASPLPQPPTPPPVKRTAPLRPAPPAEKVGEDEVVSSEMDGPVDEQAAKDKEIILAEIENKRRSIVELEGERPTARKRENNRFKGRKQKRSGTPASKEYLSGTVDGDKEGDGNKENRDSGVTEDDYIIPPPASDPPPRPIRGIKVYEDVILAKDQTPSQKKEAEVELDVSVEKPYRPVRGIKVYEGINFTELKQKEPELRVDSDEPATVSDCIIDSNDEIVDDGRTYETIEDPKSESICHTDVEEEKVVSVVQSELPEKPKRGKKLYEDVVLSQENNMVKE